MTLAEECQHIVAREMARHYVKTVEDWPGETASRMDAARSKIETMTNMQLLELIGQALGEQN